jgi:mRNA-degrading endonuclease YafQ of YafQ-DinJ toxin-antitoxin module
MLVLMGTCILFTVRDASVNGDMYLVYSVEMLVLMGTCILFTVRDASVNGDVYLVYS